jgi:hypothetical protein
VRLKKGSVGLGNASKGRSDKRRRLPRGKRRKKLTMRRSARESQKVNVVGRRRKQIRESERERKKERAAQAEAAEKHDDTTRKWPRWTQD